MTSQPSPHLGPVGRISRRTPGRAATWWRTHPQLPLAVRAAVAAVLAWLVAQHLPAPLSDYPYYGPLGAVIATTTTLVASLREAGQTVAAIALGAGLAWTVDRVLDPGAGAILLVVGLGSVLAAWRHLGAAGTWVITSSLFILIIGRTDPDGYAVAYLGTTGIGALIGVAVVAVLPPLPLTAASHDLGALRRTLADQLTDLADGLRREDLPAASEWRARRYAIEPSLQQARRALERSVQAARGNWSARFFQDWLDTQREDLERLETVADTVFEVTTLVIEGESADAETALLGSPLREPTARALTALAAAVRPGTGGPGEGEEKSPTESDRLADVVAALRAAVREARTDGGDYLGAGAVVVSLERAVAAVERPTAV